MEKYGFSLQEHYCLPMSQVIELLADAGFSAVSPGWQRDGELAQTIRHARSQGLAIQSLHGPLRGMRAMWSRDPEVAKPIFDDLMQSAADCAAFGIPILVVHPWNGVDYTFRQDGLCFDHFDALVALAEAEGICIAFENLEGPEYLCTLMERYSGASVGFCWDSGHERCYAPGWDFLKRFGHRLVMTHLNDNLGVTDPSGRLQGTDDLHLLPGDGTLDWKEAVRKLNTAKRQEILNFELKIRPKGDRCKLDLYSKMPLKTYSHTAFQRAKLACKDYSRI